MELKGLRPLNRGVPQNPKATNSVHVLILIDVANNDAITKERLARESQTSILAVSTITVMKLTVGCRNKAELQALTWFLAQFQVLALTVQETLMVLLEAKISKPQGEWEMTKAVHTEIRAVLGKVLTQEDWKAIAESASHDIYAQVLRHERVTVESL